MFLAKKTGPNPIELNYDKFNALCQFKSTTREFAAEYLNISATTIDRRLKEDHGMTFTQYHESKMKRVATKLEEKAVQMAMNGDRTMLIFCLKNYAKWQDKVDVDVTHHVSNFADWAQQAAEAYEKRRRQKEIARTERRRERVKDVN